MPRKGKQHRPTGWKPAKSRWKELDQRRGTAHQRGYTYQWKKARDRHLKEEPICRTCHKHGIVTEAKEVDHIIPHKGDAELFWDPDNWQSLCKSCHSRKTAEEDGGFGR